MATKTATRKSTSRKPTAKQQAAAEAKTAERAALTATLKDLVDNFEYDEEDAAMVRAFESLTSHYSEGNAILILAQAAQQGRRVRGLSDVGGFGAFVERGRSVKKGEHKSIFIWARAAKKDGESDTTVTSAAGVTKNVAGTTTPAAEDERSFYFPIGIFHVSQTEDKAKADARRAAEQAAK